MKHLIEFANAQIKHHPEHKSEIVDLVCMAKTEIDDGGSESDECRMAIDDIKEIVKGGD